MTINAGRLCLDDEGTVKLRDVVAEGALHGLAVTDFVLVEHDGTPLELGGETRPLREVVEGRRVGRTLAHRCDESRDFGTFLVELRRPAAGSARVDALEIVYSSAGREHTVRLPMALSSCDPRPGRESCEEE